VRLTDRERKLILLAFDPAAEPGEAVGAVRALAKTWITKYPDGHALVKDLEQPEWEIEKIVYKTENPCADFELTFGKHRGEALRDIPVSYLLWVLHNFEDMWPTTREAIERYLAGK
jgi:hypothetical protein